MREDRRIPDESAIPREAIRNSFSAVVYWGFGETWFGSDGCDWEAMR